MAESTESTSTAETKKVISPRVEIDTSPPFESVKEAVDRFGGSGPWIPLHLLRLAAAHHDHGAFDVEKMEEQAMQLERDLVMKEQQTLNVLKELEATKRYIEDLKVNLMPEVSPFTASPDLKLESHMPVPNEDSTERLMFMDLNQAKVNLNKTSVDLAVIQASVESLNQKLRKDKILLERRTKIPMPNPEADSPLNENHQTSLKKPDVDQKVAVAHGPPDASVTLSKELKQVNFEAEQYKKMTEASRYEVMKAMTEIERTKNSIKMAEMRLNAAKKMEEAAKAVEVIALAETNAHSNGENSSDVRLNQSDGITLSLEEYQALAQKAKQADELCKTKFIDANGLQRADEAHQLEVPILEKFEETTNGNKPSQEGPHQAIIAAEDCSSRTRMVERGLVPQSGNNSTKFKFSNSHSDHRNPDAPNGIQSHAAKQKSTPGSRPATSMGDVLGRKFVIQDDVMLARHVENHSEERHVSLSQMLREQSRLILHATKSKTADRNVEKQYCTQRKKFGFIKVPLATRQTKKKAQPLNQR